MLMMFDWKLLDLETDAILDKGHFDSSSDEEARQKASKLGPPALQGADLVALQELPFEMEVGKCWRFTKQNDKHKLIIEKVGKTQL